MKKKRIKLKKVGILIVILLILTGGISEYVIKEKIYGSQRKLKLSLNKSDINLKFGEKFIEYGATASYNGINLNNKIKIKSNINETKVGKYEETYTIKYKKITKNITRKVNIVDDIKPEITLKGDTTYTYYLNNKFKEPGYDAKDNYDGNITDKVKVENNINFSQEGTYKVTYTVQDSSKNEQKVERTIIYKKKESGNQISIPVLNYHFFYDPEMGETCNEVICERISDFRKHLDYLKENGYKTLTIEEFRAWMYEEIELPEKSILITIDDGAMGTGKHNGNKLIPILEEYKMHATLFLITGWWNIENYQSEYLDIESHTNDMHQGGKCANKTRGAQLLCSDYNKVVEDLKKSIEITKSTTAFCFPFYAYDEQSIKAIKEVGFQLAFIGENRKAKVTDNKYKIPRYPIEKDTSFEYFKSIIK